MKETKQKGAALIIFAVIFALAATAFLISQLDASGVKIERDKKTSLALAEAKVALIGSIVGTNNIAEPTYLPNPDLKLSPVIPEGSESGDLGASDISLIGKFPWYSLGVSPLRDGWNECLWYVVSGRFKKSPHSSVFNWDTQGQITVVNENGNTVASNLAALIISPGAILAGQDRKLAPDTPQCGGNYDAKNYLDAYNSTNAVAGEVNYFEGSTNSRLAPNDNDKTFVLAQNDFYNDQFSFVTVDEIFIPIIRRSDFANQIDALLNDADLISIANEIAITSLTTTPPNPSNLKGTGNLELDCGCVIPNCATQKIISNADNQKFCENWRDMLLLTQLPSASTIKINGVDTSCNRLLIFGGQKTVAQARITTANRSAPANYLEDNLSAFIASSADFEGMSKFNANNPSADILKCI